MIFNTDNGGLALTAKIKLFGSATTWNTRLSQIARAEGEVIICTSLLSDLDYIKQILDKRSKQVTIFANSKCRETAEKLKALYPSLRVLLSPLMHANMVLIAPSTVWFSSAEFGKSSSFESTVGIKSNEGYEFCLKQLTEFSLHHSIQEVKG